jgi:hypothetical protein
MRITFLLLTLTWAASILGPDYALASDSTSRQSVSQSPANAATGHPGEAGRTAPAREGRPIAAQRPLGRSGLTKVSRPVARPIRRQNSKTENAMDSYQPGSIKFGIAERGGLIPNGSVSSALPARPSIALRSAAPPLNNVRHRGPNPAVVGGSANFHGSSTGAVNGTQMNRKR